MTKQTTTMAGAVAVIAIIAAAVLLGILPQVQAAATSRSGRTETEQGNELLKVKAIQLAEQSEDLEGLEVEVDELRSQIPDTADLASVTRVIVNALDWPGSEGAVTLLSIRPQVPPIEFVPRVQLAPGIGELDAIQPPPDAPGEEVAGASFQEVPLTITATAGTVADAFKFVDRLNMGPRLLAVARVEIASSETSSSELAGQQNPVTITVDGSAFLVPSAAAVTAQ